MSEPGRSGTATAGSSSSACTARSSGSSTTSTTWVRRPASWASTIPSSSTTTSPSGSRWRTATGPPSTSSIATAKSVTTTSARATTRRPSERSSSSSASTRTPSASTPAGWPRPPTGTPCAAGRPTSAMAGVWPQRLARAAGAQSLSVVRRLGRRGGVRRAQRPWRLGHVPLPGARSQPGPHPADLGRPGPLHGAARRPAARRRPRPRHRRAGEGTVYEPRMYQLIRQRGGAEERAFEVMFHEPGVRAYVFTFG
jgi:hypothetical protein